MASLRLSSFSERAARRVVFLACLFALVFGRYCQNSNDATFARAQDSYSSFSSQDFGVTLPQIDAQDAYSIGAPPSLWGASEKSELGVSAAVARYGNPSADASQLFGQDRTPVALLVVETTMRDSWHIYTPTQGSGGKPTRFQDATLSGVESLELGEFFLASPWTEENDALGQKLEILEGVAYWIAPIYAESSLDLDAVAWDSLAVDGAVDALVCSSGPEGACVPKNLKFNAKFSSTKYDKSKLDELIGQAVANLERANASTTVEPTPNADNQDAATTNDDSEESNAPDARRTGPSGENTRRFASQNFAALLLVAFLGGLILNITPCVLPVVGLKILSFFEQAGRSRASAFILNLWYALGVLLVFGALAFASVGLSFLFTRSIFQVLMSVVVFAMALSLMGVWELLAPSFLGGQKSSELSSREGPVGAIFKGVITTLLAIPCGAPLLSPALDWASEATRQGNIALVVVVYLVIGLGMTSPFLVAGAFPELLKFFPKPGPWMETFRKTMGYFLLIATVWILYSAPLEIQLPTVAFLFAVWFACWNIGRNQFEFDQKGKKVRGWVVSILILIVVALFSFDFKGNPIHTTLQSASRAKLTRWAVVAQRSGALEAKHWGLFDRETLDRELKNGRIVAVDFTADWCMNCKFLEKTILHTQEIQDLFDERGILTLTADWTNLDAKTPDIVAINELLDAQGARQVPTLMIFTPQNPENPIVLRGLYTKGALVKAIDDAVALRNQ